MDPTSEIIKIYCVADRALTMAARPRRSCSKDHGPVRNFEHGAGASGLKHHSDPVGGEDWEWCRPAVGQGWPVVWAEECGGTAVLVLALDNVPAKREVWMGWMLEVWEERMEVGLEAVVWCSMSQVAEQPSVERDMPVAVALARRNSACVEGRPGARWGG